MCEREREKKMASINLFNGEGTLAKRVGPPQDPGNYRTTVERSYRYSFSALHKRHLDKRSSVEVLTGVKTDHSVHSFLRGDIVYAWKSHASISYLGHLFKDSNGDPLTNEEWEEFKTFYKSFSEVRIASQNSNLVVYSTFNHLRHDDLEKFLCVENLMNCLIVPGIVSEKNKDSLFFSDKMFSPTIHMTNKQTCVFIKEKGMYGFSNLANKGDGFQSLFFGDKVEWYLPKFDDRYDWGAWEEKHQKCVIKQYRKDNRITLLYKRHDSGTGKKSRVFGKVVKSCRKNCGSGEMMLDFNNLAR